MSAHTVVRLSLRSTNYYVISAGATRLMVDLGWPGMLGGLKAELQRKGIALADLTHGFATHYHIDHAGLAQELKATGMRLIVTPEQVPAVPLMKQWTKPQDHFVDIRLDDTLTTVVSLNDSRAYLQSLGLAGELIHTPGHSDDSVSLLLDDGSVFTGDLTPPMLATEETAEAVAQSWQTLRERGAKTVYPGHGEARQIR
jgi:ribonuclease/clavin/mitogillin